VALRIEQLLLLPGFGLTGALLPIVAQNYGARNFDRVRQALFFCSRTGVMMMLFASLVLWFAGAPAMRLFSNAPEVVRIGSGYLLVDGFILPIYILLFAVLVSVFTGFLLSLFITAKVANKLIGGLKKGSGKKGSEPFFR